jgi:hypothetical protein
VDREKVDISSMQLRSSGKAGLNRLIGWFELGRDLGSILLTSLSRFSFGNSQNNDTVENMLAKLDLRKSRARMRIESVHKAHERAMGKGSPVASLFCTTIQASSSKNVWRPSMQTVPEEQMKVFVSVVYYADDARAAAVHVDFSTAVHEALMHAPRVHGTDALLDPIGH